VSADSDSVAGSAPEFPGTAGVAPAALFPDEDYRFQIRFSRASPGEFFRPTENRPLLSERRHWLAAAPERYSALLEEGVPLLEETLALAREWRTLPSDFPLSPTGRAFQSMCSMHELNRSLGMAWEPDFLLLDIKNAAVRLLGGCVCFPSSWSLEEKVGKPIELIHDVVPGLNSAIGPQIQSFLTKLKPGLAWLRSNWGLSRSAELNQHPARNLARLDESVSLEDVWLRIENQALVALPLTNGVLFGIRIDIRPLATICEDKQLAARIARALRTMPDAMARYKGLDRARAQLLTLLPDESSCPSS